MTDNTDCIVQPSFQNHLLVYFHVTIFYLKIEVMVVQCVEVLMKELIKKLTAVLVGSSTLYTKCNSTIFIE